MSWKLETLPVQESQFDMKYPPARIVQIGLLQLGHCLLKWVSINHRNCFQSWELILFVNLFQLELFLFNQNGWKSLISLTCYYYVLEIA